MNTKAIFLLALSCASQPASAQSVRTAQATLATPTQKPSPMVIDEFVWRCTATNCTGPAGNGRMGDRRICHELAKKVGVVVSYVMPRGALTGDELARCNKGIATAP